MATLFTTAVIITAVQGLAFDGKPPRATNAVVPDPTYQLPEITEPPSVRDLFKRQNGQTVLVGPDNTCGFVDGRPGAAYTCASDYTCALVTTSSGGAIACCDSSDCGLRVDCLDYVDIYYSSSCNNGCLADTFTAKCTNIDYPYCGTVTLFDGIIDYYCNSLSISTPEQLYTTYDGETDGRSFTEVVVTLSSDTFASEATQNSGNDGDDNTQTSPINSPAASPSSGGGTKGGSSSSPNSSGSNSGSSKSSTPIGPIVGGVVGGVAVLALVGLGLFFILRRNKKNKNKDQPAQEMMHQAPGPNGPTPPVVAGGYQQPPYNNNAPYGQPQYATPTPPAQSPPQGYFAADQKPNAFVGLSPASPDRNNSTSPVSQITDANHSRQNVQPTSPTSTVNSWGAGQASQTAFHGAQPSVPPTVHEAGGNVVGERGYDNHRGQFHELGP
ncbi:Uu.00g067150.m01.CDS01 [Anthostomella pinea]|uniref:Uu.00g067150.m01.CDS01 n=1 Tax=Anthostomella pinea TaxID=933095 RepID=A0AAI8YNE1_9PEZI|nr:Uu.00g067150.m01.CDS01 [Anthostomella pinea]